MRFIHTADWHLGRSLFNTSLIEDQAFVLNELLALARDAKPDVLIVAGDIYDRAVPPTDAVKLLDDVLSRLILDHGIPVILIAGNHDSPLRLEFAARLVASLRLYVYGTMSGNMQAIDLFDKWGRVSFYPVPYGEPAVARECLRDDQIISNETATRTWVNIIKKNRPPDARLVLVNHAFVMGGTESESERPLTVGSAGLVSAECFDDVQYVALGHLHRPQCLGDHRHIHYSGSILKYSFSEADHQKSVNLVDLESTGVCRIEQIPLKPRRDVRCVDGSLDDLLNARLELGNRQDYIKVRLLDKGAVFEPMNRLRDLYPNIMDIERKGLLEAQSTATIRVDHRKREMLSLFTDFYNQVTGTPLTDEQTKAFVAVVDRVRQSEREA